MAKVPGDNTDGQTDALRVLQNVGLYVNVEQGAAAEKPAALFERSLSSFLTMIYGAKRVQPIPVMLGNGRPVNLLLLYSCVTKKGGHEMVTAARQWASVSEEVGFDSEIASSVKLVYAKYLTALERWTRLMSSKKMGGNSIGFANGAGNSQWVIDKDRRKCTKNEQVLELMKRRNEIFQGENGGSANGDIDADTLELRRKRESLIGTLNWLRTLAKKPRDPSCTVGLFSSYGLRSKPNTVTEHFTVALMMRQARLAGKEIDFCNAAEDQISQISISRCSLAGTYVGDVNDDLQTMNEQSNSAPNNLRASTPDDTVGGVMGDSLVESMESVGDLHQVEVPPLTSKLPRSDDDSETLKWLGTQIWPPESPKKHGVLISEYIGKGRKNYCLCHQPGSVECVRFHVAEKRYQLNCELLSAFYAWGFHQMGEEVALSWTEEEERKFLAIIQQNPPSSDWDYWDHLRLSFRSKNCRELVSYYFNVFVLGLRSYQNRNHPSNIDSDDEELKAGFTCNTPVHEAVRYNYQKYTICTQNRECMDTGD